jgi:hypothetical protein
MSEEEVTARLERLIQGGRIQSLAAKEQLEPHEVEFLADVVRYDQQYDDQLRRMAAQILLNAGWNELTVTRLGYITRKKLTTLLAGGHEPPAESPPPSPDEAAEARAQENDEPDDMEPDVTEPDTEGEGNA